MNILLELDNNFCINYCELLNQDVLNIQDAKLQRKILNGNCPSCHQVFEVNIFLKQGNNALSNSGVNTVSETRLEIKDEPVVIEEESVVAQLLPVQATEISHENLPPNQVTDHLEYGLHKTRELSDVSVSGCDDEKNKYKCTTCYKAFSSSSSLKKHEKLAKHSKEILGLRLTQKHKFNRSVEESFQEVCKTCGKRFSLAGDLKKHMRLKHRQSVEREIEVAASLKDYYTCELCLNNFMKRRDLKNHMETIHLKKTTNYFVCTLCEPIKQYLTLKTFRDHQRRKHATELDISAEDYQCPKCEKTFSSSTARNSHYGICIESKIPICFMCKKEFVDMKAAVRHIEMVHLSKKAYQCHICGLGFNYSYQLKCHVEAHNYSDPRPFKCEICNKGFKNKDYIENHILYCHRPVEFYEFVCELCPGRRFPTLNRLKNHQDTVHTTVFYDCKLCNKKLKSKTSLHEHMQAMHTRPEDQKRYPCTFCNYVTHNKKYLPQHMLQHTDEKDKFKCENCSKAFVTKHLLDRHSMIHSDKRPHSCNVCQKRFRHAADLTSHIRLHTGEKPFRCQVCDQRFSDRGCYRSHLVGHERHLNITLDKSTRIKPIFIDKKSQKIENETKQDQF